MVIQHNLSAMNTNRMFKLNNKKKAALTEKLSSGYRINRSADDAAGLAISEKMRRQIRGLTQASANAQDGISMVQIADGAMAEVQDMLHRSTELSIKAANGTLTDEDRSYIQKEIAQIKEEINGIGNRTTFNEIQVLKGKDIPPIDTTSNVVIKGSMPAWATLGSNGTMGETYTTNETYQLADGTTGTASINHEAATIDFSAFDGSQSMIDDLEDNGFYTTCCTCTNHYSIRFTDSNTNSVDTSGEHYIYNIGIKGAADAADLVNRIVRGTNNGNPQGHYTRLIADPANSQKLIVYDERSKDSAPTGTTGATWPNWRNSAFNVTAHDDFGKFGQGTAYSADDASLFRNPVTIELQIGAEAGQHMKIDLPSISTGALGINGVNVNTTAGADSAITSFKKALTYVSEERSRMGAYQNRLEHTIKNLDNVVENTQAAESRIRDTDMAKMMVEYANQNILTQVGQVMMAQANQKNQGVLQLLQ